MRLKSVSQFTIRLGRPVKKWDSKLFSATGDVVAGTISLANWEPIYLNLIRQPVNVLSSASISTTLDATTPTLLLYLMADGDAGATGVQVRCTIYVLPPFVWTLLAGKPSPVESWQRIREALVADNLEAHCMSVLE